MRVLLPVAAGARVGGIVLLALGKNPLAYYGDVLERGLFNWGGLQETITRMAPLLLIAAGLIVSFQRRHLESRQATANSCSRPWLTAALAPALGRLLSRGHRDHAVAHRRRAPSGRVVADSRFPQGALRHQRDHHVADDELSRHEPRQCA